MSYREIERVLRQNGWFHVRTHGSHYIFQDSNTNSIVPVPYHRNKDLSIGTLKSI